MRLAILSTHPIQYYGPLFRELARRLDLEVFFAHRASPQEQGRAGFGQAFDWDIEITEGFAHSFLVNVARNPGTDAFGGCDTPDIGDRIRSGRFDALLLTGWGSKTYLQALFAAKRQGLPVFVRGDSHLGIPRGRSKALVKRWLYPPFLRLFDAAAYVGERSRAYYAFYGYPADRLFFSPHCVDTERFAAGATPEVGAALRDERRISVEAKVVLMVGKMISRKRPLDVIAASSACRARGMPVEIMVAGSGPMEEAVVARAAQSGVPTHSLGFRNQTELPQVYAAADCLVLASDVETWGLVANEALSCNLPIIVSDACGCVPDLTTDPAAGRAYPMGDVDALAQMIAQTMAAPRTNAPGALAQRYGLSAAADGIEEALAAIVRISRHARPSANASVSRHV